MSKDEPPAESPPRGLALTEGYSALASSAGDRLDVKAPDGRVCLSIQMTPEGPRVEIAAAALAVTAAGTLSLAADTLRLDARRDLAITTGGDVNIEAAGALVTRAVEQRIEATLGDVRIGANDDVRVDGERVLLNSPEAPRLRRLDREAAALEASPAVDPPSSLPRSDQGATRAPAEEKTREGESRP